MRARQHADQAGERTDVLLGAAVRAEVLLQDARAHERLHVVLDERADGEAVERVVGGAAEALPGLEAELVDAAEALALNGVEQLLVAAGEVVADAALERLVGSGRLVRGLVDAERLDDLTLQRVELGDDAAGRTRWPR